MHWSHRSLVRRWLQGCVASGVLSLSGGAWAQSAEREPPATPGAVAEAVPSSCGLTAVSTFWSGLEQVCAGRAGLASAVGASPELQATLQEVRAYCGVERTAPAFAALDEAARQALLLQVATASGVALSPAAALKTAEPMGAWLLRGAAERWLPDARLRTGALVGSLAQKTVGELCTDSGARDWLQSSCGPLSAEQPLVALRDRLVVDVAQLPRRAWERSGRPLPPDVEVVVAWIDTLSSGLAVEDVLARLADPAVLAASLQRCAADTARASSELVKREVLAKSLAEAQRRAEQARSAAQLAAQLARLASERLALAAEQVRLAADEQARLAAEPARLAAEQASQQAEQARSEAEQQLQLVTKEVAQIEADLTAQLASVASVAEPQLLTPGDARSTALEVVRRLLADGPDLSRDRAHYRRVVLEVLRRGGVSTRVNDEPAIDALIAHLRTLREAQRALRTNESDREAFREGATALLLGLERALYLARVERVPSSSQVAFALALVDGEVEAALSGALAMVAQALNATPPEEVEEVVECASAVLQAADDAARKRALLACTVLPPWTKSFIFDANVGALSYEPGDYRLAGDATLGYNGTTWGVVGHGYASDYDLSTEDQLDQTEQRGGRLELWGATRGQHSPWRFDGRFSGGGDYHDTSSTRRAARGAVFFDQRSILLKALLLAGVRYQTSTGAFGLWLGGGPQYELYEPDTFSSRAVQGVTLTTDEHLAARFTGRIRGEYHVWPSYLTTRVRVDVDAYQITRQTEVTTNASGSFATSATDTQATQLELNARCFIDVEALRLLDFVPGVGVGFNYFYRAQADLAETSFLPIAAVGLRREVF